MGVLQKKKKVRKHCRWCMYFRWAAGGWARRLVTQTVDAATTLVAAKSVGEFPLDRTVEVMY